MSLRTIGRSACSLAISALLFAGCLVLWYLRIDGNILDVEISVNDFLPVYLVVTACAFLLTKQAHFEWQIMKRRSRDRRYDLAVIIPLLAVNAFVSWLLTEGFTFSVMVAAYCALSLVIGYGLAHLYRLLTTPARLIPDDLY